MTAEWVGWFTWRTVTTALKPRSGPRRVSPACAAMVSAGGVSGEVPGSVCVSVSGAGKATGRFCSRDCNLMTDLLRQEISATGTLVVKVGTRVVSRDCGTLNHERIAQLAQELNAICETGRRVVLVSSGAVAAGMSQLGFKQRPAGLAQLQAAAAVGQASLIEAYDRTLREHGRHAAQVLLTGDDLNDRGRYLNVRNTLLSLLEWGVIPIINENDTVAVDELMVTFGDNDRLAALVTNLLQDALLVILSDVEGLYDADAPGSESRTITTVHEVNDSIMALVDDHDGGPGRGGMSSKLEAARLVSTAGENVIIASGHRPGVLADIVAGKQVGTLILAQGKSISSRKRWIGLSAQTRGSIFLDDGACRALTEEGRSLLAIGIVNAEGDFGKGDVVSLRTSPGIELARGLSNYPIDEIRMIQGLRSEAILQRLGYRSYEEVIHRDNLVILRRG